MTTLPQTTSRFPRPTNGVGASNGHPIPVAPMSAPMPGGTGGGGGGLTPSDVLRVLRQNAWWIVLLTLIFLAGGYGVYKYLNKYHQQYTASGLIRISQDNPVNPTSGRVMDEGAARVNIEVKQATEAGLLKQDDLLNATLNDNTYGVQDTSWYRSFLKGGRFNAPDAQEDLADRISIQSIPDSELLRVSVTAPSAEDAQTLTDALIRTHVDRQKKTRGANVRSRINDYNQQATELRSEINNLTASIASTNRSSGSGDSGAGIEAQSLLTQQALRQLQIERSTLAADLETAKQAQISFNQAIAKGLDPFEVQFAVDQDQLVQTFNIQLQNLKINKKQLANRYGEESRQVKEVTLQIRELSAQLEDQAAEVRSRVRQQLQIRNDGAVTAAQALVDNVDAEIEENRQIIADLTRRRDDLVRYSQERERKSVQLADLESYISALTATRDRAGSVERGSQVQTPDFPSSPSRTMTLGAAGVLGLGLGLGLAFLRELTDTSVRSPRDISRVGQMTLLGMVPHEDDDPQSAGIPLNRAIEQAPGGIIAESFRQIRSRLNYAAPLETTRTIMVTSPAPDDGKTVVSTNLAASLALAGRRVLLVDANFRRPQLGKLYGIVTPGFALALQSPAHLADLVGETPVNGLSVLPAGEAMNTNELVESHHFTEFVDRALEDYDQIIFDAGPVMVVSESAAMASRVDGVITVARAKTNSRGLIQRLRDNLRQLRAEHIGVVLNGVRAQTGGYYARNIRTFYDYSNKKLPDGK